MFSPRQTELLAGIIMRRDFISPEVTESWFMSYCLVFTLYQVSWGYLELRWVT